MLLDNAVYNACRVFSFAFGMDADLEPAARLSVELSRDTFSLWNIQMPILVRTCSSVYKFILPIEQRRGWRTFRESLTYQLFDTEDTLFGEDPSNGSLAWLYTT